MSNTALPTLFSPYKLGNMELKNRIVMAPMTRSRAIGNVANALIAEYYAQRADAGLIITEGISPSPNGLGYARIPGLYSEEQTASWKAVTDAVHAKGGKIFAQIMHTGRISHTANMPQGAKVVGASPIPAANTPMWTDTEGMQPLPTPEEITHIPALIAEYVQSAKNAIAAGFDGIEIHSANGYLPMQFLSPNTNRRTDNYGGSIENRNRFVLELATAIAEAIGKERTGIRLSPYNHFNEIGAAGPQEAEQYTALVAGLKEVGVVYVHLLRFAIPAEVQDALRQAFGGPIILNAGYDAATAEEALASGKADLISFGTPYVGNPDLVTRFATGAALNKSDESTFYTANAKGYTDYPVLEQATV